MICVPSCCIDATAWSKLGAAKDTMYVCTEKPSSFRPWAKASPACFDSGMS